MSRCSIVVPVHGRSGLTARLLDALLAAPETRETEIIVVNDASPDDTDAVLARYGRSIRVVTLDRNGGFAEACNRGAAVASGEFVLFLNNDVLPRKGWLERLVARLDAHPGAAAAGARLLYPDGTIQHAGVVFGQDGHPRHIYAGFPGEHPAVTRSRPYRAVTGACMLVRRAVFEALGGFDTEYRNGLEDVDLCLRLGEAGHEVHYCHDSVLEHLESVTRGRSSPDIQAGIRRFQERWGPTIRPDDLDFYVRDGLLTIAYDELYPLRISISPLLAAMDGAERTAAVERRLVRRSRQVAGLLRDVVHLTAQAAGRAPDLAPPAPEPPASGNGGRPAAAVSARELDDRIRDIEARLRAFHRLLATRGGAEPFTAAPGLEYRGLVEGVRALIRRVVPEGATVLVISRGDDALVELERRVGWHFPRSDQGGYAGAYPADGAAAVDHLEALVRAGAEFLVVPEPAEWWLAEYPELGRRLGRARIAAEPGVAAIYDLCAAGRADAHEPGGNLVHTR